MSTEDWSAATFEGLVTNQRRSVAGWSGRQRFEWLAEAVDLAAATGALQRVLAEKQRAIERAWGPVD